MTDHNAEVMLRGGPPGTRPEVAGDNGKGADVRFLDDDGNVVLRRELKCNQGFAGFNTEFAYACRRQIYYDGEVYVQVPAGTDAEAWLGRWCRFRGTASLMKYRDVRVHFMDDEGGDLGTYDPYTWWQRIEGDA